MTEDYVEVISVIDLPGAVISNFDDFEKLLHHTFYNELRIVPEETMVILTEPTFMPVDKRSKVIQIMFETFYVPALRILANPVATLRISEKDTGIIVTCGETTTDVLPVVEWKPLRECANYMVISGGSITKYLAKLLTDKGYSFTTTAEMKIVKGIKEKLCYVSTDYEEELKNFATESEKSYEMPNGQIITLGAERFKATEPILNPGVMGIELDGLPTIIYNSIMKCDPQYQAELCANIVLAGGSTLFPGFVERLEKELKKLLPDQLIKIVAQPDRKYAAWLGGSLIGNESRNSEEGWTSKDQYDEVGPDELSTKIVL